MKIIIYLVILYLINYVINKTPEHLRREAMIQIPFNSPKINSTKNVVAQNKRSCNDRRIRVNQTLSDAIFYPSRYICDLKEGRYAYVLREDYYFYFSNQENVLEFGSKHLQMAQKINVFAAGEMLVNRTTILWNFNSGTYATPMFRLYPEYKPILTAKLEKVFKIATCSGKIKFQSESFQQRANATREYISRICKEIPDVRRKLRFVDNNKSVCDAFDCP
jgi:hypothetical protein